MTEQELCPEEAGGLFKGHNHHPGSVIPAMKSLVWLT